MIRVLHGDCLEILPTLDAESIHAVITDPPYHLTSIVKRFGGDNAAPAAAGVYGRSSRGFMGKNWDGGDIAFRPETWEAVARVMKPGAFMVAFASTRGYHRMVCAIEDAGFVIHPMLAWVFGSGFPKATRFKNEGMEGWRYGLQALKPAMEPICLAQKPMKGTGTANWLEHGCGGLNIDACRIGMGDEYNPDAVQRQSSNRQTWEGGEHSGLSADHVQPTYNATGRWPANLVMSVPEEQYLLKSEVSSEQKKELFRWLHENS